MTDDRYIRHGTRSDARLLGQPDQGVRARRRKRRFRCTRLAVEPVVRRAQSNPLRYSANETIRCGPTSACLPSSTACFQSRSSTLFRPAARPSAFIRRHTSARSSRRLCSSTRWFPSAGRLPARSSRRVPASRAAAYDERRRYEPAKSSIPSWHAEWSVCDAAATAAATADGAASHVSSRTGRWHADEPGQGCCSWSCKVGNMRFVNRYSLRML